MLRPEQIIPFYGGNEPELFEIERRCMDRDGKVITYLDQHLPGGLVLDVGAGNGFTAQLLNKNGRHVVALEPDHAMIDLNKPLVWSKGVAQDIPFHDNVFVGAYATWAFFFTNFRDDMIDGLAELERVVKSNHPIIIIDNAGEDEFTALGKKDFSADKKVWQSLGFSTTIIETSFRFDNVQEMRSLFTLFFGATVANRNSKLEFSYRVAAFTKLVT